MISLEPDVQKPVAACVPVATEDGSWRIYAPLLSVMSRVFPSTVQAAEAAGLEVGERLVNFSLGVHHERTVPDDGLVNRLATE